MAVELNISESISLSEQTSGAPVWTIVETISGAGAHAVRETLSMSESAGKMTVNMNIEVVCFAAGTKIKTARGEVAIESLKRGDEIVTVGGELRPLVWCGGRTLDCRRHPRPHAVMPIRIAADAFGPSRPARDLFVSPGHAICVSVLDELLIPASLLVNGTTITQADVDEVTYWHIELESHDIVFAEGLPTESYLDVGNRGFFVGGPAPVDGAPEAVVRTEHCRPYIIDAALVRVVRERLQARAIRLGWKLEHAPLAGLHIDVAGERLEPEVDGLTARFLLPPSPGDVWLVSQTSVPSSVGDTWDNRTLGVCLRGLTINGRAMQVVPLADPLLEVGFHPIEGMAKTACRWTAGRALLPARLWEGQRGRTVLQVDLAGPALPRWTTAESRDGDTLEGSRSKVAA